MAENEKMGQTKKDGSTKADKNQKSDKKSNPGFFAKISRWTRELKSELKKVQWPTVKQTTNNTVTVISCVAVVGVFIWVFDFAASGMIEALISLVG